MVDFAVYDPHAVTGIVKSFFRELPERLIPTDLNNYAATVSGTIKLNDLISILTVDSN